MVVEERAAAGRRLVVRHPSGLKLFFADHFPEATAPSGSVNRVASVARFRDSKAMAGNTPEMVMARGWSDTALLCDGVSASVADLTAKYGLFGFVLGNPDHWQIREPCAVVENPALFLTFERLTLPRGPKLALYAGGRVSDQMIGWLAAQGGSAFSVAHFPDYDPVGLSDFIRLHEALGDRVRLHVPERLDELFRRFAQRGLLARRQSQSLLAGLRRSAHPQVRRVLDLIEKHNAGLEQEALLVGSADQES